MEYDSLIEQNVAIKGARRIAVRDSNGYRVGQIPLGSLTPPNPKKKLYSFSAFADIHLNDELSDYSTSVGDFQTALEYCNETENVDFSVVVGDVTVNKTAREFELFRDCVAEYSPDTEVYAVSGNHDAPSNDNSVTAESSIVGLTDADLLPYTGRGLYYSFTYGDDVFIFVGEWAWSYIWPFSIAEMQWLYETLEANRNKRCFVFQHLLSFEGCGNPYPGINPTTDILGCENTSRFSNVPGRIFLSLMRHYKNCIWFHAHSHTAFECQEDNPMANYDQYFGIHSVHIPSLAVTRKLNKATQLYDKLDEGGSQGYVVDVYADGIHLRGRDFVKGEFLPIASYWLDTTLQTIPAGTYTDSTGTINP